MRMGKYAGKRQGVWMKATQTRVGSISSVITGMKSLRMLGLTTQLAKTVQHQRSEELRAANRFRMIGVFSTVIGFTPLLLTPVLTFAATSRTLDTSRIFASLAYLLLLSNPLTQLLQVIPQLVGALVCFDRIANFLELETHVDDRKRSACGCQDVLSDSDKENVEICNTADKVSPLDVSKALSPTITEVPPLHLADAPSPEVAESAFSNVFESAINIKEASFTWSSQKTPTLQDITLSLPISKVTLIVGPVGSGKSTFCKALLGELRPSSGTIYIHRTLLCAAFCDQASWLPNVTIKECIIGCSHRDEGWYYTVLQATELQHDLDQLPNGDFTLTGSNGIALSGGQKVRVALAPAVYARARLRIFVDVFSGLDKMTETKTCENLFGSRGLVYSQGITVVLVSHNARHLHFADYITALGADGHVVEHGTFSELQAESKYVASLVAGNQQEETTSTTSSNDSSKAQNTAVAPVAPLQLNDKARQVGDIAVYRHYFSLFGPLYMVFFLFTSLTFGFFYNFSSVWLKFWSDHNAGHLNNGSRRGFFLGIYTMIQLLGLLTLGLFCQHNNMRMAVQAGTLLHLKALSTTMAARLEFLSHTDAGTTVNRFSQDMTIIDGQLSFGLSNTALTSAAALGQAAVIAVASPYVAACYPFLIVLLYIIQKVYLRTSRQLRFLDLEAKAPL